MKRFRANVCTDMPARELFELWDDLKALCANQIDLEIGLFERVILTDSETDFAKIMLAIPHK